MNQPYEQGYQNVIEVTNIELNNSMTKEASGLGNVAKNLWGGAKDFTRGAIDEFMNTWDKSWGHGRNSGVLKGAWHGTKKAPKELFRAAKNAPNRIKSLTKTPNEQKIFNELDSLRDIKKHRQEGSALPVGHPGRGGAGFSDKEIKNRISELEEKVKHVAPDETRIGESLGRSLGASSAAFADTSFTVGPAAAIGTPIAAGLYLKSDEE